MANKATRVVVTGGNTGVGYWIAYRLLERAAAQNELDKWDVILGCRSVDKAEAARQQLQGAFKGARVSVMQVDTSSPASVKKFCAEYKQRYDRLDVLCANAGIMPIARLNWSMLFWHFVRMEFAYFFETSGKFLEQVQGAVTKDGLGEVFATNVFGHFLMIRQLQNELSNGGRVFWSCSTSSKGKYFSMDDFQGIKTPLPYQSSKYANDLLSHALNLDLNKHRIYSVNTTPGTVMSGIATDKLPVWVITYIAIPLLVFMRLFTENLTVCGYNSAQAVLDLIQEDPQQLDLRKQYVSCTAFKGSWIDGSGSNRYTRANDLEVSDANAMDLLRKLDDLAKKFL